MIFKNVWPDQKCAQRTHTYTFCINCFSHFKLTLSWLYTQFNHTPNTIHILYNHVHFIKYMYKSLTNIIIIICLLLLSNQQQNRGDNILQGFERHQELSPLLVFSFAPFWHRKQNEIKVFIKTMFLLITLINLIIDDIGTKIQVKSRMFTSPQNYCVVRKHLCTAKF